MIVDTHILFLQAFSLPFQEDGSTVGMQKQMTGVVSFHSLEDVVSSDTLLRLSGSEPDLNRPAGKV
jgi:hypothetical protein